VTDDAFRGFRWVYARLFPTAPSPDLAITPSGGITRSEFLVKTGLVLGSLPFVSLIYGMVKGAYDVQVRNIRIRLSNIPVSFHGFRIVQISDWHVGSFVSKTPLEEAVKRINALKPDLILFTGDLVNNTSDELEPYTAILSELKASHGIFSVLGNHDYGDYVRWESQEDKQRNLQRLVDLQRSMGWDLLLDEHRHIEKEGEKITVIGVQNYSVHMRFPKYGSLPKATTGIDYSPFNILLSHDPSHWKSEVITSFPDVHLTLSGHTHGFQFGVELPQFKWSPVQYVYKEWAGLYSKEQQHLYVNRGLGFLGYPGRVGIRPEITVFELEWT
jgi:predicted MPP superfamily phosphohydrolase